jgi:hypothetical protein
MTHRTGRPRRRGLPFVGEMAAKLTRLGMSYLPATAGTRAFAAALIADQPPGH